MRSHQGNSARGWLMSTVPLAAYNRPWPWAKVRARRPVRIGCSPPGNRPWWPRPGGDGEGLTTVSSVTGSTPSHQCSQSSQIHRADVQMDKIKAGAQPQRPQAGGIGAPSQHITEGALTWPQNSSEHGESDLQTWQQMWRRKRHISWVTRALLTLVNTNSHFFGMEITVQAVPPGERQVIRYEELESSRKTGQPLEGQP